MKEHVHKHIIAELQQTTRSDTIFIVAAILMNLIILAINSSITDNSKTENNMLMVMFVFVALLIMVNLVVIFGLMKGKQTRAKLLKGLINMYRDEQVDKYYDDSLLSNYSTRYNLFIMVIVCTGVIAVVVPFMMR